MPMDNFSTTIAVASIATSGFTICIGVIAPAIGEGRSVATALSSMAQQPDASATITRTLIRRTGYDRVPSHLLLCGFDDSHFRQSILEPCNYLNWRGK